MTLRHLACCIRALCARLPIQLCAALACFGFVAAYYRSSDEGPVDLLDLNDSSPVAASRVSQH